MRLPIWPVLGAAKQDLCYAILLGRAHLESRLRPRRTFRLTLNSCAALSSWRLKMYKTAGVVPSARWS